MIHNRVLPAKYCNKHVLISEVSACTVSHHLLTSLLLKVLYLKNLHHGVSEEDLQAVFGSLWERSSGVDQAQLHIRLMKGKMRGQAFVEFSSECPGESLPPPPSLSLLYCCAYHVNICMYMFVLTEVSDAVLGWEAINGFVMRGKPLVICYGRKK